MRFETTRNRGLVVCLSLLCFLAGNLAQAQNCANPITQIDMNQCAQLRYQSADPALNAAWGPAMTFARQIGQQEALRGVQRQWISYRDAACTVQASPYKGGSTYPLIWFSCLTDVTETRTRMLQDFRSY
ncbi:MAG: DUF1311 domain-containing protein [Sulfitobacter sp.]|nr:DUF1311 domain-containing protein [Sulfitobacter sp.]